MAKDPVLPLYYNDLTSSTQDWTDEEFGAFVRLLIYQWDKGALPEENRMQRISDSAKKNWTILSKKFSKTDIGFQNLRMEEIRSERIKFKEKQKENVLKRHQKSTKGLPNDYQEDTKKIPLEGEEEKEIEEEFKKGNERLLVPSMLKIYVEKNSSYPISIEEDYAALGRIVKYIREQEKIKEDPATDIRAGELVKTIWVHLSTCLSQIPFYSSKSLKTISNNLQSITIEIQKNGTKGFDYQKAGDLLNSFGD
jgi:uncharacterized protein YdaU (DUF1376 family)